MTVSSQPEQTPHHLSPNRLREVTIFMPPDNASDDLFLIDDPAANRPWFRVGDAASWLFPPLGWLAFEWFADPAIGVVIACLKFGYSDLRTAMWLKRGDPRGFRGQAVSLCYFARGLYVVAMMAFSILVVLLLWDRQFQKNLLVNLNSILAGLVMWTLGLVLGTAFGGVACQSIARHRIRVWMDPTIHQARRDQRWTAVCFGQRNQFRWLCLTVVAVVLSGMLMLMIGAISARNWRGLLGVSLVFGIPAWWCLYGVWRSWPLAATCPDECWGEPNHNV